MKTFLYIKTHNKTGLKYFGKTTKDPFKYKGSGKYWLAHIAKHGDDVQTEIFGEYSSQNELIEAALKFSVENDITNSTKWANLIDENGLDGAPTGDGHPLFGKEVSAETRAKLSEAMKRRWETSHNDIVATQSKAWTEKRKIEQSEHTRKKWTEERKKSHGERISELHNEGVYPIRQGFKQTTEHSEKISAALKGRPKSEEHRKNLSNAAQNREKVTCEFCGKMLMRCHYSLHHGPKCKLAIVIHDVTI